MVYLSITLGAGRCDIVKGHPGAGGRIATENVHTFENNPIWKDGRFVWDIERIYGEIVLGLKKAGKADYLSIVFAGEDFVLLDENGDIKGNVLSFLDKTHRDIKELIVVIRSVVGLVAPIEAKPVDCVLD